MLEDLRLWRGEFWEENTEEVELDGDRRRLRSCWAPWMCGKPRCNTDGNRLETKEADAALAGGAAMLLVEHAGEDGSAKAKRRGVNVKLRGKVSDAFVVADDRIEDERRFSVSQGHM